MKKKFLAVFICLLSATVAQGSSQAAVVNSQPPLLSDNVEAVLQKEFLELVNNPLPQVLVEMLESSPNFWGGAYRSQEEIVLKHVGDEAEAKLRLAAVDFSGSVQLEQTNHSLQDLNDLQSRILSLGALEISGILVDQKRSRVVVGLAAENIPAEFDGLLQDNEPISFYHLGAVMPTASRYFDESPFKGGALFATNKTVGGVRQVGNCSTGFALSSPAGSGEYFVTAAHCHKTPLWNGTLQKFEAVALENVFRVLPSITASGENALSNIGSFTTSSLQIVSPANGVDLINNVYGRTGDWSIITLAPSAYGPRVASPKIYVGEENTSLSKDVSSWVSESWLLNNRGLTFYSSGASAYVGGQPTTTGRGTLNDAYPWAWTVVYPVPKSAFNPNGEYATSVLTAVNGLWKSDTPTCNEVGGGDSGGAIYRAKSDGSVAAVGIISGTGKDESTGQCSVVFTTLAAVLAPS